MLVFLQVGGAGEATLTAHARPYDGVVPRPRVAAWPICSPVCKLHSPTGGATAKSLESVWGLANSIPVSAWEASYMFEQRPRTESPAGGVMGVRPSGRATRQGRQQEHARRAHGK